MTDPARLTDPDTIAACLSEPIHLSGAIQPHGYLLSCSPADWIVRHASANVDALLGVGADELLGQSLAELVDMEVLQAITDTLASSDAGGVAQRACTTNVGPAMTVCDACVHTADGLVHVEFEPQPFRMQERPATAVAQWMVAQAGAGDDAGDFFQRATEQVQLLTGYDRVMVYRFRDDDTGEVIAETCRAGMEPYLGLRYPASDIPPQARLLYLRNRIRVIPDAGYTPVPLVPARQPDGRALDLSQHVLRSVSPVHLEYLRNMGVVASMSISIISGGRLWGLIACHHPTPRPLSATTRSAADLFGMFVSMRVAAREQDLTLERYERAQRVRDALAQRLSLARNFNAALVDELGALQAALDCDGAVLWLGGRWHAAGRVPGSRDPAPLLTWLDAHGRASIAMTPDSAEWNVPALDAGGLAGLMAINLGAPADWLFLFRREQVEQVNWAGEPTKALVVSDDGERIAPRRSFATWRETMRGCSEAWSGSDRNGAERIHRVLREQRGRALAHARDLQDIDTRYQRQKLRDQKQRLDEVAALLDGLGHLEEADTARISQQIERLDADLRALIRRSHADAAGLLEGSASGTAEPAILPA